MTYYLTEWRLGADVHLYKTYNPATRWHDAIRNSATWARTYFVREEPDMPAFAEVIAEKPEAR